FAKRRRVRGLSPRMQTPHPARTSHSRCKASASLVVRTAAGGRLWPPSPTGGEGKESIAALLPHVLLQPRHRDAFARQLVGALVLFMAGVAPDPVPAHLMRL